MRPVATASCHFRRVRAFVLALLSAGVLTACGGGSSGGGGDTTAPTVTATTPADTDTDVFTNTAVSATFSEAMDAVLINAASFLLSFNPPVTGNVTYDAATNTATFTPVEDLPAGKFYTATVTNSVQDEAGNALTATESWTFTTEPFISRVSVSSADAEGNADSFDCEYCNPISHDGRFVAFESNADNLVPGDTNARQDAFRRDVRNGVTVRVSQPNAADQATLGSEANGVSQEPSLNADGRYVSFYSLATNLVLDDTNSEADVFVHDTQTGATTRVSAPNLADQGTLGAQANDRSLRGNLSADARYVVFESLATNLVPGDTNTAFDVFVHDRQTGATERVSVDSDGNEGDEPSGNATISADGRYVVFQSSATNLDQVTADTNGIDDIFVHDRVSGETTRVSIDSNGNQATGPFGSLNPWINDDGSRVVFWSGATDLVAGDGNGVQDVFVHDRDTGDTVRASVPNLADQGTLGTESDEGSQYPSISGDGRYVAFSTDATNLVSGDTNDTWDVFVHDLQTGVTRRVSLNADGTQVDTGTSDWASISGDGRYVTFYTDTAVLVDGDLNMDGDVFRVLNAPLPP